MTPSEAPGVGATRAHQAPVPALPAPLADPRPIVAAGTAAWGVGGITILLAGGPATWVWSCAAGVALGGVGTAIMTAQRRAARRGDRGAQRGLG